MSTRLFLLVIATSSVAFLVYFEVMLLREFKQGALTTSLRERPSRQKPRVLHIYRLDAIDRERSEGGPTNLGCRRRFVREPN